jgi:hypothetical protein
MLWRWGQRGENRREIRHACQVFFSAAEPFCIPLQYVSRLVKSLRYLPPADHLTDIVQRQGGAEHATAQVSDVPKIDQSDGQDTEPKRTTT